MKEIKLSFPYPSTSRHNLSQDVSMSLSMGLVIPARVVEVLPGDSHRIGTSFSLLSNPLVKPLLQGVRMRYARFWVPSRIYNIAQRANNMDYDPLHRTVRNGYCLGLHFPGCSNSDSQGFTYLSNFQQSSLFDYLSVAPIESSLSLNGSLPTSGGNLPDSSLQHFNVEPYLGYIDICRNYFADSATGMIGWSSRMSNSEGSVLPRLGVCVSPLSQLDKYIDGVQNSVSTVKPYDWTAYDSTDKFAPFVLESGRVYSDADPFVSQYLKDGFTAGDFGIAHNGFCVPLMRPDRLSRLFDTTPLTSQNAVVSSGEISIGNLSFLSKLQRYLTRRFFGGTRYTDIMYSVFGQKVPHVDSPVLLDVFDYEIGSELVASTNASSTETPGVLGGYFSASGVLSTSSGRERKRYIFNECGYLIDVVVVLPRVNRASFYPDFYPLAPNTSSMAQGNFVPDFNGIGWQQPSFLFGARSYSLLNGTTPSLSAPMAFSCEPSWQQYRTLPDVCHGALNPIRGNVSYGSYVQSVSSVLNVNSPLFTFNDRMSGCSFIDGYSTRPQYYLAQFCYQDFNDFNRIFGTDTLMYDNIFCVFRYSHQVKRQVTKRFTLSFS